MCIRQWITLVQQNVGHCYLFPIQRLKIVTWPLISRRQPLNALRIEGLNSFFLKYSSPHSMGNLYWLGHSSRALLALQISCMQLVKNTFSRVFLVQSIKCSRISHAFTQKNHGTTLVVHCCAICSPVHVIHFNSLLNFVAIHLDDHPQLNWRWFSLNTTFFCVCRKWRSYALQHDFKVWILWWFVLVYRYSSTS